MFDFFDRLVSRMKGIWDQMSLNQRVLTAAAIAALVFSSLFITTLSEHMTNYTVLFTQLDAQSASEIVDRLDQMGVDYHLTRNGTTVEVPSGQADRLKIDLMAEGLPQSGVVGYEILDATNFGMSDFLQKVQYRRALEGELSRTVAMLDEVENAVVRLVIPEPSLYTETDNPPTASVVLQLRRSRTLSNETVEAIAALIASAAVEGLDPAEVTIVDTAGNRLSAPKRDPMAMEAGSLREMQMAYERAQTEKIRGMLDGAFGMGIALVNVNARLDFDRIERVSTLYDQDNSAIVSQQRSEVTNPDADGGGEETTVTNYDTGQIVENLIRSPGSTVERLSVSVMIDMKDTTTVNEDGEEEIAKIPWSDTELAAIRSVCEAAVGFDAERGDVLVVEAMDFGTRDMVAGEGGVAVQAAIVESVKAISLALAVVAAIVVFFLIIRNMTHMLDPSRVTVAAEKEFKGHRADLEEEEEVDSERAKLIRRIQERAAANPEVTARTIKAFYRGGEE